MTRVKVNSCGLLVLLLLSGCGMRHQPIHHSDGVRVVLAEVAWVKLLPNQPDSQGRFMVSTSCGSAEIKLSTGMLVNMHMGEWCETPFSPYPEELVLVLDERNQLLEYHSIRVDESGMEYIDLLSHHVVEDSIFWNMLTVVDEKPLFEHDYDIESKWNLRYLENDMLSAIDGDLYLNKVVFLDDIKSQFIQQSYTF